MIECVELMTLNFTQDSVLLLYLIKNIIVLSCLLIPTDLPLKLVLAICFVNDSKDKIIVYNNYLNKEYFAFQSQSRTY